MTMGTLVTGSIIRPRIFISISISRLFPRVFQSFPLQHRNFLKSVAKKNRKSKTSRVGQAPHACPLTKRLADPASYWEKSLSRARWQIYLRAERVQRN